MLCELHRTLNIINHVEKILLNITIKKVKNIIIAELLAFQCDFIKNCSTRNAILECFCRHGIRDETELVLKLYQLQQTFR